MPIPAPGSTLLNIQTKVRRLTRSISINQLSDTDLNEYINTFTIYDFPEHLRTFNLRTQFTFYANPYQDVYPTDINSFGGAITNPLYDFQNLYITVHPPAYIAGFQAMFSQSRNEFFGMYPFLNNIASIGATGNGIVTQFTGVVNSQQALVPSNSTQQICLLKNNVLFSSIDSNFNGISMIDFPLLDPATGNPTSVGNLYPPGSLPTSPLFFPADLDVNNNINYVTGAFIVTFRNSLGPIAPGPGQSINSQTVPVAVARPQAILFYQNEFTLRPVPDQPYPVNFEVYARPTWLMETNQEPALNEYWQYIAYGAAKKILEDRMETDTVQQIIPEFKVQESLVLRRTIVQITNERSATIYTQQTAGMNQNNWGFWGGNGF